ncbi:sigma-70 family RNA polymerase sigma factor [uncultured Vagococcus sp.]|uniref:RNA polymerase sigma factor n=1 Tax=uncultured Vagococcus sp. TaxID=189676 RepID=UPI0028D7DBFC|nr:sigma-70 family RNA polymerase sigma factor [uncultured Vagococcus sp.]
MKEKHISQLFERYYSDLILYGLGLTKNQKIAEELVSDAFYKLLLNIESVELNRCKFWLMRVMKNSYIDRFRKDRKLTFYDEADRLPAHEVNGLEEVLQEERRRELMEAIQQLPGIYGEVMILYYFLELDGKEIASYLRLTAGQVRTRLYRGRLLLKERLEGNGKKGV